MICVAQGASSDIYFYLACVMISRPMMPRRARDSLSHSNLPQISHLDTWYRTCLGNM